jgi:hypothetical protein
MPRTARAQVREAEIRTEPVREPVRAKVRTRRGGGTDKFHIPRHLIPAGIDLQWNVDSILGKEDPHARQSMAVQGWEPVTGDMWDKRFDGMFMPKGHNGEINIGGLVLEWRPMELTLEARAEELQAARHARNVEERKITAGAPDGVDPSFMDTEHPKAKAGTFLRKEIGRVPTMPIPD